MAYTMPLKELETLMLETVGRGQLHKGFDTATWHPYGAYSAPSIDLRKISNRWRADPEQVNALIPLYIEAIKQENEERQHREQVAREIEMAHRIIRRESRPEYIPGRYTGAGIYWCQLCDRFAADVSDFDYECHACRDWSGCGGGCVVMAVECQNCSTIRVLNKKWAERHQDTIREYVFAE